MSAAIYALYHKPDGSLAVGLPRCGPLQSGSLDFLSVDPDNPLGTCPTSSHTTPNGWPVSSAKPGLASLNHPDVASIHDLGEANRSRCNC